MHHPLHMHPRLHHHALAKASPRLGPGRGTWRCWAWALVAVLLLQGLHTGLSMASGPAHSHVDAVLHWLGETHALAHQLGLAHHHHAHEPSLIEDASAAGLNNAVLSLLLGLGMPAASLVVAGHAAREARPSWALPAQRSRLRPPPLPPPRR